MDNIQFEIPHERLLALVAKQLNIPASQISIKPLTGDATSAVMAVVRTDLDTANKIERKLKRLEAEDSGEATDADKPAAE
jgi:hypothetical protein